MSIHEMFSFAKSDILEKLSHPSIQTPVVDGQKNRLNGEIPWSTHNMFSIINMWAKFQLLK